MRRSSTPGPASALSALATRRRAAAARRSAAAARPAAGCASAAARSSGSPTSPPPADTTTCVAARRRGRGAVADDEAGVVDRHAQRPARRERLLQAGEARVAVHEHGVEVLVRRARAARSSWACWSARRADEDVAQAARGQRAGRPRGLEQRHELARELRPPEREQLDQHGRPAAARGTPRGSAPGARSHACSTRVARVVADEAARRRRRRAAAARAPGRRPAAGSRRAARRRTAARRGSARESAAQSA